MSLSFSREEASLSRVEVVMNHISPYPQFAFSIPEKDDQDFCTPSSQDTCGIIAFVGEVPALPYILEGIRYLENRGYDSAGISTVDSEKSLKTTKFASSTTTSDAVERLASEAAKRHDKDTIGIGHTRWATHGARTDINAHPHNDIHNRISLVHNGIIENSYELRKELEEKNNLTFKSETDTEVIVQMMGLYLEEGDSTLTAVKKTLQRLQGTWGLVIIDRMYPDQLIACKKGSPLLVGVGKGKMFIASEATAFSHHTKEFIVLNDDEIVVVTPSSHNLDTSRIKIAEVVQESQTPSPFPHWTLKEIYEQSVAIGKALNNGGRLDGDAKVMLGGLNQNSDVLLPIQDLVISACGTSLFAAQFGAHLMRHLRIFNTVQTIDAAEFSKDILSSDYGNSGVLVISQSGETADIAGALNQAKEANVPTFSVVNVVGSKIARTTNCGVYVNAGIEKGVASTKAFSCQVVVLTLITIWFAQNRDLQEKSSRRLSRRKELTDSLHRLATNFGMATRLVHPQAIQLAEMIHQKKHLYVLGRGLAEPIAQEGALKIKEISYIHAEGYPGASLKHGPFALIETGFPIILIILNDTYRSGMLSTLAEVKSRGAFTIVITDIESPIQDANYVIGIPHNGALTALLAVVPLQLLAYELSLRCSADPDHPRNLAKAVVVH